MNEQSESSSSSIQVNSRNNYKYDKYGFVLVNSIEDLLYDKFNDQDKKEKKENKTQKTKKHNRNHYNSGRNYQNLFKNRDDKTVKIVLNINNKEKKEFKINPNDSRSIESMTIKEKETDTKNDNKIKNIIKEKTNKRSNKKDNEIKENSDDDEFTFCEEENEKGINKKKKINKDGVNSQGEEEEENENDLNETDINRKKLGMKSLKQIKTKKKFYHYSQPILSPCYMTKIRKMNHNIKQAIPKGNRTFITKTYENDKKEKEKKNKKLILTWPNSSICYFNRSNKIINVNIHIPLQNVTNKNYFCTKEIIDSNKIKLLKRDSKSISDANKEPSNIIIKIVNPDVSSYRYGKINIKTGSDKNSKSKNKSYVFKIKQTKGKNNLKNILFNSKDPLTRSKCLKNKEIIKALKKKKKSKSKKKKEKKSPECITLKRRRKFGDKIYKKIMKKKAQFPPPEYQISIKTKFKNNPMDNYRSIEVKKEDEKLIRNHSINKYDSLNKNNNNIIYPSIRKMMYDENTKNKSISYIKDQKFNFNSHNFGSNYNNFTNNGNFNYNNNNNLNYNYNDNSQNFPAINSYFH